MFVENLVKLGFTEREARVYLMLFRLGPSPVSSLAKRVGMKRVSVYSVLESLISRGIVTYEEARDGRRYIPHEPDCILDALEDEKSSLKTKMAMARECVEKLNEQGGFGSEKSRVIFYRGEDSVLKGLHQFLLGHKPFSGLLFLERIPQFLLKFFCKEISASSLLVVPEGFSSGLAKTAKTCKCAFQFKEIPSLAVNRHALFVQEEKVFFLHLGGAGAGDFGASASGIELMLIRDKAYADYISEVFLAPMMKK